MLIEITCGLNKEKLREIKELQVGRDSALIKKISAK